MKRFAAIFILVVLPRWVFAAACCQGGGPKSFISLQELEDSEIGIASSFREVYGWYNPYGDLEEIEKNQTYSLSFGVAKRLTPDLALTLTLPLVYQRNGLGQNVTTRSNLGDTLVGAQYTIYRSLFQDEWFPSVILSGGMKVPTGVEENYTGDQYQPGTGNGLWEPFFGVGLQKEWKNWRFNLAGAYTVHLQRHGYTDGDRVDLTESVAYVFTRRFSLGVGSNQSWISSTQLQNVTVADSSGRAIEAFVTPTYFITPIFSVSASAFVTLPVAGWGVNHQASRAFTFTTKYGFF